MITSLQNPLIKRLVALRDKTDRDRKQKFIIEGRKEIGYAVEAGIVLEKLIVCPDIYSPSTNTFQIERKTFQNVEWVEVSAQVYAKIAYRDKVEGLLALTRIPPK